MEILLKETSSNEEETLLIGEKIIKIMPKDINLIILKGKIGSGKTILVKGMAKKLKIKEDIVSPTFGYKRTYSGLVHYDLYLIKKIKSKELISLLSEE
ncbi:MAG: tRNA (adenosine(37)-N6)-threonylcarbamoyltransferase complex ATPase subunit type 1 TsaE, partial [Mycoplasmataceae bacterium]|nr:tRNA (adenosine(37)-N6)-threonylcarbamoyltransferase complex ATPase subunit type 1 TsaE [Mycoplasmataceae bacterium]